ncbi:alpha/beta fold hydrolase [Ancylobacter terrae]|uniref:alpha/beta fold hydrolase n=1 Tax=Ancylobacter sp. sgz301288 TaxID=3342077 RepID=UPI00385CE48D
MLHETPANPVPEGAVSGHFNAADGVRLRYARWPALGARRGTVCLFTGRAESIEKYFETVHDLRRRGFAVAALDWRGQGGSQRLLRNPFKGHVGDFADYQLDLQAFVREVMLPDCPPPYYAIAHSMGAAILLDTARHGRQWFDRMVLLAPMLEIALVKHDVAAYRAARLLRALGCGRLYVPGRRRLPVNEQPFRANRLTSDPVRYARNYGIAAAHPALALGAPTVSWIESAFRLMDQLADPVTARAIRQPLLMMAAGDDEVVATRAIEHLGMRLIAGAHLVIPGARHEILQERDFFREQFFAAFDAFVPGTPA